MRSSHRSFVGVLLAATAFILYTGRGLPPIVASHFGAAGEANGSMTRGAYLAFMLVVTVGLPALVVFALDATLRAGTRFINLPNRDYWLAPERREDTIAFLLGQNVRFGTLLVVFLAYTHALVVAANGRQPPQLSSGAMLAGLVMFLLLTLLGLVRLVRRFRLE